MAEAATLGWWCQLGAKDGSYPMGASRSDPCPSIMSWNSWAEVAVYSALDRADIPIEHFDNSY